MPNHVTTKIEAAPEVLTALLNSKGEIDFNTIIPMPEDLKDITSGSVTHKAKELLTDGFPSDWKTSISDEELETMFKIIMNSKKHGYNDWYQWSIDNWGTKWNAYDSSACIDEGYLEFDTAWSTPFPLIKALAKKFCHHAITVSFADEDWGSNLGKFLIRGSDITDLVRFPDWSDMDRDQKIEALNFAHNLKYGDDMPEDELAEYFED